MSENPDPQKSGKRVQFQISPEKLENGLSTSKSSPGSVLISLQYKLKTPWGQFEKPKKRCKKKLFFCLYCNRINMDPGDDFEVLRPFSSFSGEI